MAVARRILDGAAEPSYLTGGGLLGWLTTVDHKRIAVLYGLTALVFFLVGGVEALLLRVQLARPDNTFLAAGTYNELFTMHGTTMIFLVVMPLELGLFTNFAVPLLIGARDVAFPRLNALSYWVFLAGAIFLHASFFFGGAPDAGWFGYANLTERYFSPGTNLDFWVVGLLILGTSTLMSGINFGVTIVNMRAPGMTFMRMPMFVWTMLVTVALVLATSRAPIRSGTAKFVNRPSSSGITTRKIMVVPCIVKSSLYVPAARKVLSGRASWTRRSSASTPPTRKNTSAVRP